KKAFVDFFFPFFLRFFSRQHGQRIHEEEKDYFPLDFFASSCRNYLLSKSADALLHSMNECSIWSSNWMNIGKCKKKRGKTEIFPLPRLCICSACSSPEVSLQGASLFRDAADQGLQYWFCIIIIAAIL
ncbi:MAG: hypothetical protein K2X81_02445, partial [Candidatus Obscuribacterales bacterium]|nr:hypothetical protein [Candidatus Obscuribacterales bacterium]